jgi:hypothetical protein
MWAKIEMGRLQFFKLNQDKLRIELYSGLVDIIHRLNRPHNLDNNIPVSGENNPNYVGKSIILPSSFIGGNRYMSQLYQDAMSVVRELGKPDLFITFTCNPTWPEIEVELSVGQKPSDRPDIIARVFKLKLDELFHDLFEKHIFGRVIGYVWVIEFQKRGLPHCHMLIMLDQRDKPITIEDIDKITSAELPDTDKFPEVFYNIFKYKKLNDLIKSNIKNCLDL